MGGGMPMPVSRTPVEEREVVFRNGVVYRADPPPGKSRRPAPALLPESGVIEDRVR
jgi:hypothetical protein